MLRCIIVDDEPLALDLLEDNIKRIPFLQLVARCKSAMEAIEVIQNDHIDLVFSDIQMQGLNGMQFIKSLTNRPMFIMITAYDKYAVDGFEMDVVDYLLKPVAYERFVKACNKALERYNLKQAQHNGPTITDKDNSFIFLQVDYSMVKVVLDDIKMIEGVKDYVKIHFTNDKKTLLVRISMKAMEEMLPTSKFIRIHKSYIVNIAQVTAVRKNSLFINDIKLPVGEQYKDAITKLVNR